MYGVGFGYASIGATTKSSGASFSYILDTYSGAVVAFSLRKLSSTYSGSCIRVRRSSDNAEQNIGFVANILDTATLSSFVGSGDGFVTTWYDQSGNNRNAVQSSASFQNKIVSSGSLLTMTGKSIPLVKNNGTFNLYTFSSSFTIPSTFTYTFVYDALNTTDNTGIGGSTFNTPYSVYNGNSILVSDSTNYKVFSTTITTGNKIGTSYRKSNTNVGVRINNTSIGAEQSLAVSNGTPQYLMNRANVGTDNTMTEAILWNTDYSSDISTLNNTINTFYGIY
jgi:hypothetical protein